MPAKANLGANSILGVSLAVQKQQVIKKKFHFTIMFLAELVKHYQSL